jgi:hypothetical protein
MLIIGYYFSIRSILMNLIEGFLVGTIGSYLMFLFIPQMYVSPNDLDVI